MQTTANRISVFGEIVRIKRLKCSVFRGHCLYFITRINRVSPPFPCFDYHTAITIPEAARE